MKNPLQYQITEYDCGPTSLLNAISFLFDREVIPPEIVKNIMLYCLDCSDADGISGKKGTSRMAMRYLSSWLDRFGRTQRMPIESRYISGSDVFLGKGSEIAEALKRGGAVVVRVFDECSHYVLITGEAEEKAYVFDPYFCDGSCDCGEIAVTLEHPFSYNRIVPFSCFNREVKENYALGKTEKREAVLIFNTKENG